MGFAGVFGAGIMLQAEEVRTASLENCQGIEEVSCQLASEMSLVFLSLCAMHGSTSIGFHSQRSV